MSIHACRVIEVKTAGHESFSPSRDTKLAAFLAAEEGIADALTPNGTGMVGIPAKTIKRAIRKAKSLELAETVVEALKEDVAFAERRGDEYVDYLFY